MFPIIIVIQVLNSITARQETISNLCFLKFITRVKPGGSGSGTMQSYLSNSNVKGMKFFFELYELSSKEVSKYGLSNLYRIKFEI